MKAMMIVLALSIASMGFVAAETAEPAVQPAPVVAEATHAHGESCAAELSEEDLAAALALQQSRTDLEWPEEVSGSGLPPCPTPGGSCDRCELGSGTCVPDYFGSCYESDTGLQACQLPNGGGVSCIGGKTIHQTRCSCVAGGQSPCTGACLGSVGLASYSCQ